MSQRGFQSSKPKRKSRSKASDRDTADEIYAELASSPATPIRPTRTPIEPRTEIQKSYFNAIKNFDLVFATGPAGCGKTWIAGALAAQALDSKYCDKIIITRPAVEAGENFGFLPGELEEKYEPYMIPFKDVFCERLGKSSYEYYLKIGSIEAAPLAFMRGRTLSNAWIILDEAQNTTPAQMKMFLTRIGENCKVIVNGDITQKDINGQSGLLDAIERLHAIRSVKIITFGKADIVRSGLVQEIIEAYEK